jgi:hypothetical protein
MPLPLDELGLPASIIDMLKGRIAGKVETKLRGISPLELYKRVSELNISVGQLLDKDLQWHDRNKSSS